MVAELSLDKQMLQDVLRYDARRCLLGFPHPFGTNAHRKRFYTDRRDRLTQAVEDSRLAQS